MNLFPKLERGPQFEIYGCENEGQIEAKCLLLIYGEIQDGVLGHEFSKPAIVQHASYV